MTAMDEGSLKALLSAKIQNSIGYQGGRLSQERQKAARYYAGEPFGNEIEGRSQVVSRDVAEAVDGMMPSLMKIFASGDEVVKYEADQPDEEAAAKQATEYANWIFYKQNAGFTILHDWFKSALLMKNAEAKIWWDDKQHYETETYSGLSELEFLQFALDPDLELLKHESYLDPDGVAAPPSDAMSGAGPMPNPLAPAAPIQPQMGGMPGQMPPGAMPMQPPVAPPMLHDASFRRTRDVSQVRIMAVPPDEFLIDRRAVNLEEVPFTAHRQKRTISDLVEAWPDLKDEIEELPGNDEGDFSPERIERFQAEDETGTRTDEPMDPAMREVWVTECYLRVDFDGDGIAELRQITTAGASGYSDLILENEEIDSHPWASLTPIPMPHKYHGMSLAEKLEDVQLIKSTVQRLSLDNMYVAISPQIGAVEGQVNLDDLLNRRPGGVVRIKSSDALVPINSPMFVDSALQMLAYFDSVAETRTGVRRFSTGPGADAINSPDPATATEVAAQQSSSQERCELIARIFAETGVKRVFKRILELICKHQQKPKSIKLRDKWVPMDPREWSDQMGLTVHVGLGTGNKQQQVGVMTNVLNVQKELLMGGKTNIVSDENVYNATRKLCEASDLRASELYFTDPATVPPPQPRPDPKMAQAQGMLQLKQAEQQNDQQQAQQQAAIDQQHQQMKTQADLAEQQARAKADMQIEQARMAHDLMIERLEMQQQFALKNAEARFAMQLEQAKAEHRMELMERELKMKADAGAFVTGKAGDRSPEA